MARIIVGMSGGVDSSVAAALLAEAGHEVIGVTLRTAPWAPPEDETARFGACCSAGAAGDARTVARQLGVRHYLLNHEREFGDTVVADFVREYRAGRTPSPCVVCNREVKFGTLLRRALAWQAEAVATGHYARTARDPASGRLLLLRGRDAAKDQSYFLWPLRQEQLGRARFPVGAMTKAEVREAARARGLRTWDTPESQELCFIAGDYRDFLRARAPDAFTPGPILDERGRQVGSHVGLGAYTVGQRRGLGAGEGAPRYVLRLDPARNALVVGDGERLQASTLRAADVNLIAIERLAAPLAVQARIRHRAPCAPAVVAPAGPDAVPGAVPGAVEVRFDRPQRAVTPGQSVVFYDGDVVIGGARIIG
jgi:tRNA-specific 2-thiouridylase